MQAAVRASPSLAPGQAPGLRASSRPTLAFARGRRHKALSSSPRRCTAQLQAAGSSAEPTTSVEEAVQVLHQAAETSAVPPKEVFAAMRQLEKAGPTPDQMAEWPAILGGTISPGRRWRLLFTTGTKDVQKALKNAGAGGGKYIGFNAVQRWDASQGEIENGVYLGRLAALTFKGPYSFQKKILAFDFQTLTIRLGPLKLPIKIKDLPSGPDAYKRSKDSPFFSFFYVDDRVIAARGRGGGIAVWARTSPSWELEKGIS